MNKFIAILTLCIALATQSFAQENSLLWKVSGKGLKQDSYLFGTMHILCPDDFEIKDKVSNALKASSTLTLEVDAFSPENQELAKQLTAPDKEFLNTLSPEQLKSIETAFAAEQIPMQLFDMVSPVGIMSFLVLKSFNCPDPTQVKLMENELVALAKADSKPVEELETLQFQMDLMNSIFTAEELYNYVQKMDTYPALTQRMVKAYKEENLAEFNAIMFDNSYLSKENQEMMLTKRNENWAKLMPERLKKGSNFFAVGAGHLIGEHGLINLLKKQGYKVTPIFK